MDMLISLIKKKLHRRAYYDASNGSTYSYAPHVSGQSSSDLMDV
ncbi:Unknown protein sequence [Pseudomonas syringae pv. maculicola]|nr:Unknown protein sequence [Pseudomonas savastanoi pv. phaseolicola]KPB64931.1 Unknown protein sequence [Pseudomonas savastanoi pv. phaseolicola]KPB65932.1 Unknown protein sequence [Pseudomonas amygdali pv. mellea]KPB86165.1 Unknown protein sequence [Pseudomonas syringae pv. maculicola]RMQ54337.1 hypothetical protein ALQ02_102191 [Pseudomonas savastanoi pv. phaseolicola]